MSRGADAGLTTLSTTVLIEYTRCEIERFQRFESTGGNIYALELFRRAVVLHDEGAWAGLYTLYERLIFSWVLLVQPRPHSFCDEDILALVGDTFLTFARSISAPKFANFADSVPALLAYLKCCTRSCTTTLSRRSGNRNEPQQKSLWKC